MSKNSIERQSKNVAVPIPTHNRLKAVAGAKRISVQEAARLALDEWAERESRSAVKELQKMATA